MISLYLELITRIRLLLSLYNEVMLSSLLLLCMPLFLLLIVACYGTIQLVCVIVLLVLGWFLETLMGSCSLMKFLVVNLMPLERAFLLICWQIETC